MFRIAAAAVLSGLSAAAHAAPAGPFQGFTKLAYDHDRYDVHADGTSVETRQWALKVLSDQGVDAANQASVSYSRELQTARILAAYTLKADGRRVDAPPSNYQEEGHAGHGAVAPMFSDIQTESVVFPDVAAGDTVVFSYRITDKQPMFPGQFSMSRTFSKFVVDDDASVSLTAPAGLALQVAARGVEGGALPDAHGRKSWQWHYRNQTLAQPEPGAVSSFDYGPLIVATTFKDYAAIAAAYEARAKPQEAITPRIHALAQRLTTGIGSPRDQARALYDWVAHNIKYAGHCVGNGSVVPHAADRVLANRMGDCKDHTALMQALLADRGIASTPALINAGTVYRLPAVPSVAVFNHVINYIPSLDLYLDSTAEDIPFGKLPSSEYGKPVLHTADFRQVSHTPAPDPSQSQMEIDTELDFRPDGSAVGRAQVNIHGSYAAEARDEFANIPQNLEDLSMRRMLTRNGFVGTGIMQRPAPGEPADRTRYGGSFTLADVLDLPGPDAWPIHSPYGTSLPMSWLRQVLNQPARTVDYVCSGTGDDRETLTLHLPPGTRLLAVPRDREVHSRFAHYVAHYSRSGNTLTVSREFTDVTPGPTCTPQDAEDFKPFAAQVLKDLRSPLMYE